MRATRKAIWICGIIVLVIGIWLLLQTLLKEERSLVNLLIALLVLAIGLALTISGIIITANANKDNKQYLAEYQNKIFITTCHHCKHKVEAYAEDFAEHRNYPEGFIYCPVCHKPLSMYAFDIYDDDYIE